MKKPTVLINRKDKKKPDSTIEIIDTKNSNVNSGSDTSKNIKDVEVRHELSTEDLYARELEIVIDEYMKFTRTYKQISKQLINPIKMKKNAGAIYLNLANQSQHFNQIISTFKERAVPTDDLKEIHQQMIEALSYIETYNNEFPELMKSGNFKRIHEVSKGLDEGHKGIKSVFLALEEREKTIERT